MKVGIYSNNPQVNNALLSMCASCGCKIQKIINYNKTLFKGSDMVIIDLDNCADSDGVLAEDVQSLPEILFVGISKELDIIDNYRQIMNVEKKPFTSNIFKNYKKLVLNRLESSIVVTKDENRTYDELGLNLAETFGNSNISIEERFNALKKTIESKSHYDSEDVFLKKIGLVDVEYKEPRRVELEKIDIRKSITDDAIVKYRIRKLKMMNLSNKNIDDKINEIINSNIEISVNKKRITSAEKDILSKLREKGQNATGKSFKERKLELESQKKVEVEKPIEPATPPPVQMPKVEPIKVEKPKIEEIENRPKVEEVSIPKKEDIKVEEIKDEPKVEEIKNELQKPTLNRPILSNGPPLKATTSLKKPIIGIEKPEIKIEDEIIETEINEPSADEKIANVKDEKPEAKEEEIKIPENPPIKKPMPFRKPQLSIEEDKKPKIVTPPPQIQGDIASDPLFKLREKKQREKEEMLAKKNVENPSNNSNKTVSSNNKESNTIKDNNENGFGGSSLVDQMHEKIGYINTHRSPKKESAFDIANKKSKPPR